MKKTFKLFAILAMILVQSCSNDDDDVDCATVVCAQPVVALDFKIVDAETEENILGSVIPGEEIKVMQTATTTEVEYMYISEDNLDILRVFISESGEYSVNFEGEEIFSFSADAERQTDGCCSTVILNDLSINGAAFEIEAETGIYIIKKEMEPSTDSKSLENYHGFFENTSLQISPDEDANSENELLTIDVTEGDKLVFKLLQFEDPVAEIADDETTKIVYFEIDPDATEFTLTPENFRDANAVIGLSASIRYIKYIDSGEIKGEKLSNNEWKISIDVSAGTQEAQYYIQVIEDETSFTSGTYDDVWMPVYNY